MRRKWCRGESLRLIEQRLALPPWYPCESLRRGPCDDQLDVTIVDVGRLVRQRQLCLIATRNEACRPGSRPRSSLVPTRSSNRAAWVVIECITQGEFLAARGMKKTIATSLAEEELAELDR